MRTMRAGLVMTALAASWALPLVARADTIDVVAGSRPFVFEPARLTVQVGDTVTWTMGPGDPHTVTSGTYNASGVHPDGLFDSGQLRPGETFSVTFVEPGEVRYVCAIHADSGMTGRIVVESSEGGPTAAPTRAAPTRAAPTDAGPTARPTPGDERPGDDAAVAQVLVAAIAVGAIAVLIAIRIRFGRRQA